MWIKWISLWIAQGLSTDFSKTLFAVKISKNRLIHNPTAPTTTTTDLLLLYSLYLVKKGVVHNYEFDL